MLKDGDNTQFRIGSQTKMFTVGVFLDLMASNPSITLDTTIDELLEIPAVKKALPEGTGARIGHYTVKELMNMTTDIQNFLAVSPTGDATTLLAHWAASQAGGATGGYGSLSLPGYGSPSDIHDRLVELALSGDPMDPLTPPYEAQYSNSNAVILSIIAEALTDDDFSTLFTNYLTKINPSISKTVLQETQGDIGQLVGTDAGVPIVNLDPNYAWTSGAIITTMPELLTALKYFYEYNNNERWAPSNSALMDLHGQDMYYGLGLFAVYALTGIDPDNQPVLSVGHAGAIPGSGSFSGWLTNLAQDPTNSASFGVGLSVYSNGSTIITEAGFITSSSSEALFLTMIDQLYRQYRSTVSQPTHSSSGGVDTFTYGTTGGITGGFSTTSTITSLSGTTLKFQPLTNHPYTYFLNTDALSLGEVALAPMMLATLDPVFYYYGTADAKATALTIGGTLVLPDKARIESRANGQDDTNPFIFMRLQSSSSGDIVGQVAAYGTDIIAVVSERGDLEVTGAIEAHGYRATALEAKDDLSISGQVSAVGSAVTALDITDDKTVNLSNTGSIWADSYAYALKETGNASSPIAPLDPKTNGAVAVKVQEGTFISDGGTVSARSGEVLNYPDFFSQFRSLVTGVEIGFVSWAEVNLKNKATVTSDGYGVDFLKNGGDLVVTNSEISGAINSIHNDSGTTGPVYVNLENSKLIGAVKSEASSGTFEITADAGSSILSQDVSNPLIEATGAKIYLDLTGTTIGYVALPELGQDITLLKGVLDNSKFDEVKLLIGHDGLFNYTAGGIDSSGEMKVKINGLAKGYSPNATRIYKAFTEHTKNNNITEAVNLMADGNNLSPESQLDQLIIGQNYYRQAFDRTLSSSLAELARYSSPSLAPASGQGDLPYKWILSAGFSHFIFDRDSSGGYSGFETYGNQASFGLGLRATETFSIHAFMALGHSKTKYDTLTANIKSDLFLVGGAMVYQKPINPDLTVNLAGSFSVGRIENHYSRRVGLTNVEAYTGAFTQTYLGADLDLNFNWRVSGSFYLRPRLNLNYLMTSQDGLAETPEANKLAALTTESIQAETLQVHLGLGGAYEFEVGQTKIMTLSASAGWEHLLGDVNPVSRGFFSGDPSNSFVISTSDNPRDALAVGANLEVADSTDLGASFNLGYLGQLAKNQDRHQFTMSLKYSF
ncbi:MAG: autotransporter domain-containing protein [Deltaproteobacteria bacterium]|nr:autotransporter domain-containing protein [Deltaproteobacteria bacterium]